MLASLLGGCFLFPNEPPVARFTITPAGGNAPITIQFNGQESYDPDGRIASWRWDFGDGETGNGVAVLHHYVAPGEYVVELTVEDQDGAADTDRRTVTVSDPGDFSRRYEWNYAGVHYYWDVTIPKWLYQEYKQRPRGAWGSRDYDAYVLDPLDDDYMESLGNMIANAMGNDYYRTVECAFNFVQAAIAYIPDPEEFEYPRYPIESLVDEIGDCEDTAILYASLVRTLGYGALIAAVDTDLNGQADHMITLVPVSQDYARAVSCPLGCNLSFWEYRGGLYAMAETTGEPQSTGYYYPLGCDPWGLTPASFEQIWDVSCVDLAPKVARLVPRR